MKLTDHLTRLHVERGKERGGTVPLVVMGPPLHLARSHRQERLRSIEGLNRRERLPSELSAESKLANCLIGIVPS